MRIPKNNQEEELLRRVDDLVYQSERDGLAKFTNFLAVSDYQAIAEHLKYRCEHILDGGYPDAVFKRLIINYQGDNEIICLTCTIKDKYVKISHRDVLGALMNLGIKRDHFGDLWIDDGTIVIYVLKKIHQYIIDNLTQINQLHVKFDVSDKVVCPNVKIKELTRTVSSLRLDTIVANMINVPRTKA